MNIKPMIKRIISSWSNAEQIILYKNCVNEMNYILQQLTCMYDRELHSSEK